MTNNITQAITPPRRKFIFSKSPLTCTDEDAEKIISETRKLQTLPEIKDFLKKYITSLLSKSFFKINLEDKSKKTDENHNQSPQTLLESPHIEEIRKTNENLIHSNHELKGAVVYLYKQLEVSLFSNRTKKKETKKIQLH